MHQHAPRWRAQVLAALVAASLAGCSLVERQPVTTPTPSAASTTSANEPATDNVIQGHVTDGNGKRAGGVEVSFLRNVGPNEYETLTELATDDSGHYVWQHAEPGYLYLQIERKNQKDYSEARYEGGRRTLNLNFGPESSHETPSVLRGHVTWLDGRAAGKSELKLVPRTAGGKSVSTRTNAEGGYDARLPLGTYDLTVTNGDTTVRRKVIYREDFTTFDVILDKK